MHPADTALVAACRRDDAPCAAATWRAHHTATPTIPVRARIGRRLVAWDEHLQSPAARPTTTRATA